MTHVRQTGRYAGVWYRGRFYPDIIERGGNKCLKFNTKKGCYEETEKICRHQENRGNPCKWDYCPRGYIKSDWEDLMKEGCGYMYERKREL